MSLAKVVIWGTTVGAVSWQESEQRAVFRYDPDFLASGIELSPLRMPLATKPYTFSRYEDTFKGLPGMLADSLPDKFGGQLIDAWCALNGRNPMAFNPVDRLLYVGTRSMGALEYLPAYEVNEPAHNNSIDVAEMVKLASLVLSQRSALQSRLDVEAESVSGSNMANLLQIGTSAGGARAKAVIAWNPKTNDVRSGQIDAGKDYEHWLIKFDGVVENKDKELADPKGYGNIEYAYHLMALDAGITMAPCRLLKEGGRSHFMTQLFDRVDGRKLHMQSLCALGHYDFNLAGTTSYEQALLALNSIQGGVAPVDERTELFRRMVFNVIGMNRDDHTKQISFLMDRSGRWYLAPAYDITYSYNPMGQWTSQHQMQINGKRNGITIADLFMVAEQFKVTRSAKAVIDRILEVINEWPSYAKKAGVSDAHTAKVDSVLDVAAYRGQKL